MKTIALYALMGLLVILFVLFTSSDREATMENTIEVQKAELQLREEQVWSMEKETGEKDDAIFMKNKVIEYQKRASYDYIKEMKETRIELDKTKDNLVDVKAELEKVKAQKVTEQPVKSTVETPRIKTESPKPAKQSKPEYEEESKTEPRVETPKVEEKPKPVEEPKPTPEPKPEPKKEEEPVVEEEPEEEPVVEEPEEEPVVEEPKEEEPIKEPEPDPKPEDEVQERRITAEATAYIAMCDTGCTGFTATGYDVRNTIYYEGMRIVAVDPNVIPLGTIVEVSYGGQSFLAIAYDTGGHIKGNRVDLLVSSLDEALQFGRRSIEVTIKE